MQELANHKDVLIDVLIKQHIFKNNIITKKNLKDVCALMSTSRKFYERINPIYQKAKEISQREFIFHGPGYNSRDSLFLNTKGELFFSGGKPNKFDWPESMIEKAFRLIPREVFLFGENIPIRHCSISDDYLLIVTKTGHLYDFRGSESIPIDFDIFSSLYKKNNNFIFPEGITIQRCYAADRGGLALSTQGRLFYIEHNNRQSTEIIFPENIVIKTCHINTNNVAAVSNNGRLFTFTLKDRTPIEIWHPEAIRIKQCIIQEEALYILSTQGRLFKFSQDPKFSLTEIKLPNNRPIEKCSEYYEYGLVMISKDGHVYRHSLLSHIEKVSGFPQGTEIEHCAGNLALSTEGKIFKLFTFPTSAIEITNFPPGFNLKKI